MSTRSVVQPRTSHSRNDGAARKNGKSFMRKSLGALTVAGLALGGSLLGATAAHATVGISDQMRTAINTWFERDPNTPITAAEAAAVLPSQYINKALNLHLTEVEVDSLAVVPRRVV